MRIKMMETVAVNNQEKKEKERMSKVKLAAMMKSMMSSCHLETRRKNKHKRRESRMKVKIRKMNRMNNKAIIKIFSLKVQAKIATKRSLKTRMNPNHNNSNKSKLRKLANMQKRTKKL